MPLASFPYPIFKGTIKHKHFVGRMFLKILNVSVRHMEMQVIISLGKKMCLHLIFMSTYISTKYFAKERKYIHSSRHQITKSEYVLLEHKKVVPELLQQSSFASELLHYICYELFEPQCISCNRQHLVTYAAVTINFPLFQDREFHD